MIKKYKGKIFSMEKISALNLDLSILEQRLVQRFRWWPRRAALGVRNYKRFLYCLQVLKDTALTPSEEIDEVWHYHILDTQAYHTHCQQVFGHYIHHTPANTRETLPEFDTMFQSFATWYEITFHEPLQDWSLSWQDVWSKSLAL